MYAFKFKKEGDGNIQCNRGYWLIEWRGCGWPYLAEFCSRNVSGRMLDASTFHLDSAANTINQ